MNVRIATQIKGDGKEWIELERTNPAGYCMYVIVSAVPRHFAFSVILAFQTKVK